jgi:hypothetical protein
VQATLTIRPSSMNQTKYEISTSSEAEVVVACARCSGKTTHVAMASVIARTSDGYGGHSIDWRDTHQIIQCLGCKSLSYRVASSCSEDFDHDEDGNTFYPETEKLFPPRLERVKGLGDEKFLLPKQVMDIYDETLAALHFRAPVLAAIGLRAMLESVCKDKNAVGRDLLKKIDSLVDLRLLTPAGAQILHKIRTLGNAAAHEVKPHTEGQLALAMDIVEHLLKDVYILPKLAETEFSEGS